MKKTTWLLLAAAVGLLTVPATLTHAADDTATKTSTAQFGASAGTLTLDKVPDLHFDDVAVGDLIAKANDLSLQGGAVSDLPNAADGDADLTVQVTDNRGTNAGWTLSAQAGQFVFGTDTTSTASDLNVSGLKFDTVSNTSTGSAANAFDTADSITTGATVWAADATNVGSGVNTAEVSAATLSLAKSPRAKAGTYRAPITWTLTTGPDGTADGAGN
ncbi:WxL domain-containing protein [Lacticaseibacillus baoqingensis]|uniref:WxL domain-containing protein n=1 Tax=Lacticaseibacillus baoqingensis TaxID=2486013 RepID=A0ABW4EBS0_9LACO|nr:WxL domain-containing protein [Lacticaseibacillus baoqingensis]